MKDKQIQRKVRDAASRLHGEVCSDEAGLAWTTR
jgi:hypothetical protein